jgi:hypothetical protein
MCDVCQQEGRDSRFHNGKRPMQSCRLYRVYKSQVANIRLCHIHAIELFCIGESRFLESHPKLAIRLHSSSRSSLSDVFAFS